MVARRVVPWLAALAFAPAGAAAQDRGAAWVEDVEIRVGSPFERRAAIAGKLRIPPSVPDRAPAVVLVNSSPGFDGRSAFYAEALNAAGIASFEIDMFQGRGIHPSIVTDMPHAFQALAWLARHPRIDGARVGITGFSYGGQVAMLTASEEIVRTYAAPGQRYTAHVGIYPQCWSLRAARADVDKLYRRTFFDALTGRPVHILVGDRDDYGSAGACREFVDALPPAVKPHVALTVYEGATFGWDHGYSYSSYEATGNRWTGGIVRADANPEIATRSRTFVAAFFSQHLAAR